MQKIEKIKITTPKNERNIQNEKESTTPAPIFNFLNQFNFKEKKIEDKKQESDIKIKKSEKEIFMSKFNQIKTVFEKEKKKNSSSKLKSNTSSRIKTSTKLKTNPKENHHNNSNNGDANRLEEKVVPPNAPTPRFSFINRQEVEKILLRKVDPQTTTPDMTTTAPPLHPAAITAGATGAVQEPQGP